MVKLGILLTILPILSWSQGFSFQLEINPEKYVLSIKMKFPEKILLSDVRKGFRNGALLIKLNDSIKKMSFDPVIGSPYLQTQKIQFLGISSVLVSQCEEDFEAHKWIKTCTLRTDSADGGKYMNWKNDQISCRQKDSIVFCEALIQGQSKPLSVLGIQLANHQKFSLRAKVPALKYFSQVWIAISDSTYNVNQIKLKFKQSGINQKIDQMLEMGLSQLKDSNRFQYSME